MKPPADSERLLDEVFDENADFRAASLEALLCEARQHRQARRRNRVLAVLILTVAGAAALIWKPPPPGRTSLESGIDPAPQSSLSIVRSAPLPASMLVETRATSVTVIHSTSSVVALLETARETPFLDRIGDGELFTLLAGRPAVLVRHPTGQTELVLLNESDRSGFPMQ